MNEDKLNESCRAFRHERKLAWLSALEKQRLFKEETTGHVIKRHFVCILYSLFSKATFEIYYISSCNIYIYIKVREEREKPRKEVAAILSIQNYSDISLSLLPFNTGFKIELKF